MLLDPSCSGSGTAASRLDALLPSRRRREAAQNLDEVRPFGCKLRTVGLSSY